MAHRVMTTSAVSVIGMLDGGTLIPPTACEADNRATFAPPFAYNTCVDRNGDGMITTSNGLIPLPWHHDDPLVFGTVDTAEDECIISFVPVTGKNAAHLAVNKDNDVWVGGNYRNNTFDLVDGDTGAILETFDVGVGGHGGIIACDDVLWSVSTTGLPGVFRYDTNFGIDDPACCVPDILVDSNNDGVIDFNDNDVEETSALIFPVNSDDDNGNLTADFDDPGPVAFEDDLKEIQLFVPCYIDPIENPAAWWSLSWNGVACGIDPPIETIRVWRQPDKSDGNETNPGPGQQINNGCPYYEWPPPATVWLESLDLHQDVTLTLKIHYDEARTDKSDTAKSSSYCKPFENKVNRGYAGVAIWMLNTTAGSADIEFRTPSLCGEGIAKDYASSSAWMAIFKYLNPVCHGGTDDGDPCWGISCADEALCGPEDPEAGSMWLQMGYTRWRHDPEEAPPSIFAQVHSYMEWKAGPDDDTDYNITLGAAPQSGFTRYQIQKRISVFNLVLWDFSLNELSMGVLTHPNWVAWVGDGHQFMGEVINTRDNIPGTAATPCTFEDLWYQQSYSQIWGNVDISEANPNVRWVNTDPVEFHVEMTGPNKFIIYDKHLSTY